MRVTGYDTGGFYDEMFDAASMPRPEAQLLLDTIRALGDGQLERCQQAAERILVQLGITFNVYGDSAGTERPFPFDLVPRIVTAKEWDWIERGLKQRIHALNQFINDIYHDQKILKDGVIPEEIVRSAAFYRPQCVGINPPKGVWCHITGTDLVRHSDGQIYVLEDNLRVPSGVSYMLENRDLMKRTFPQVFEGLRVRPVFEYPSLLLETLEAIAPRGVTTKPVVVLLTPGMYNSAYFEHSYLAQKMGIPLVEGRDLVVEDKSVWMRTTKGLRRVHVIYRRIDDDFLDPETFRADSLLGVPGLVDAYRAGRVSLANAPGNGVADDKVMYAYVPDMIRYYEGEEPILPNVPTYLCWRDQDRQHVLQNLEKLVVKAANEAGGYGMLVGPHSTAAEREAFAGQDHGPAAQLHRAADARPVARADARRRPARGAPRRPASLHPVRRRDSRRARRAHAGGAAQGIAGRELVAGRRQQGHVGAGGRRPRMRGEPPPLLSRVADSVYWMARYIERAENVARFIGVNLNLQIDLPLAPSQQWQPLIDTSGDAEVFKERFGLATQARVIEWLAYDTRTSARSRRACASRARTRARCARRSPRRCGRRSTRCTCRSRPSARCRSPSACSTRSARSAWAATCSKASPTRRCRTTRPGTSCASAACWSAPTRPRASST